MSAREYRSRRWERWNTRPGQRALASRYRRERFTSAEVDAALDSAMETGHVMGRLVGERDLYYALARDFVLREDGTPQDLVELAAFIGGKAITNGADNFVRTEASVRRAWEQSPEKMRRLAEILDDDSLTGEQQKQALEAFAREIGVFPEGPSAPAADDLLDVADAVGATPDAAAEEAQWWADPDADDPGGTVVDLEQWLRDRDREQGGDA
ncbi:hypothetical protein [Micromonospora wenchangensis]|uniref:hypothetical protein n=1 Tax=Micromonospora wenchangensis TaxID=1185415 RepID=UPI003800F268